MNPIEQEVVRIHEAYAPGLLRYAAAISHDYELARDAVQEVLLRYFMERRLGRMIENPRGWAYRVLRNHLLDRLSSSQARCEVGFGEAEWAAPAGQEADAHLLQSQAARELTAVLSARELDCLRLRAEGLSYEEIASVMEIQPGTVGALLARAYRKVREVTTGDEHAHQAAEALMFLAHGGEALAY